MSASSLPSPNSRGPQEADRMSVAVRRISRSNSGSPPTCAIHGGLGPWRLQPGPSGPASAIGARGLRIERSRENASDPPLQPSRHGLSASPNAGWEPHLRVSRWSGAWAMHDQVGVPFEDVEVSVDVEDRGTVTNRDGADEAVDELAHGLAAVPTRSVVGGGSFEVERLGRGPSPEPITREGCGGGPRRGRPPALPF